MHLVPHPEKNIFPAPFQPLTGGSSPSCIAKLATFIPSSGAPHGLKGGAPHILGQHLPSLKSLSVSSIILESLSSDNDVSKFVFIVEMEFFYFFNFERVIQL